MARTDVHNRTRYWQDATIPGLSCLVADFTTHDFAPHRHDAMVIAVTEIGGAQFTSRGKTEEATSAGLLVFNADEPHSSRMLRSERWRYRSLYFTSQAIKRVQKLVGLNEAMYFTDNRISNPELARDFLHLHHALEGGSAEEQQELLISCMGQLAHRHASGNVKRPQPQRDHAKVSLVQKVVRERHAKDLSLHELGMAVNLTPFQLIGLFKRATGLTPHSFITQTRLKAAIAAMKRGSPLSDAALTAGFYDQSALTKHFKHCYGITPLQWVRSRTH